MEHYYKVNEFLLSSIGQWPYQKKYSKLFFYGSTVFLLVTQGFLQTGGLIAARCEPAIFLEALPPVMISLMCIVKYINFIYNADKMKDLLDAIKSEWNSLTEEKEIEIFKNWAYDSRKSTLMYAGAVYGSLVPLMISPIIPFFIDLIPDNSNDTIPRLTMFHVEYFIDVDKYYYPLLIHSYFGTMAYITVVVAIDTMFMVYVQYACSIFVILGHRLENLVRTDILMVNANPNLIDDEPYRKIIKCIIKHSDAIEYAHLIESANSVSFLIQLGINMICISFTGLQSALKVDQPHEAFKFASFTIGQTFHLFFESWPPQRLADESERINEYTMRAPWYNTSLRCRKLLQLIIMRSRFPCQLTAGNFYILNLQNFSAVVRSCMSMFTLLSSTQ